MDRKKFRRGFRYDGLLLEEVIMMSDDDLRSKIEKLRGEIDRARSQCDWDLSVVLEKDLCYVQREYQIREARYWAHQEYFQRLQDEDRKEFLREQTLPEYKPDPPPRHWFQYTRES